MKTLSILLITLFSLTAFAKDRVIKDSTCDIYLPTTQEIASWGSWQQFLIDKGYNPIEFNIKDYAGIIDDNILVASISYTFESNSSFGKSSICSVGLELKRVINKDNLTMVTLFTKDEDQKTMTLWDTKIKCAKAEATIKKSIPNCELK